MSVEPIAKPTSRAAERKGQKAAAKTRQRKVYALVTIRDKRRCRACTDEADPSATDMTRHGHHHHIRFRSAGGQDTSENLALLCNACHADVHAHRLIVTGNASGVLTFEKDGQIWTS